MKKSNSVSYYLAAVGAAMLLSASCIQESDISDDADVVDNDADKNGVLVIEFSASKAWEKTIQCNEMFSCDVGVYAGACYRGGESIYSGKEVGTITATSNGMSSDAATVYDISNRARSSKYWHLYTKLLEDLPKDATVTFKYTPVEGIEGTCMVARLRNR